MASTTRSCSFPAILLLALSASAQVTVESLKAEFRAKQKEARQKGAITMDVQKQLVLAQVERVKTFLANEAKGVEKHNGRLYLADLYIGISDREHAKEALVALDTKEAPAQALMVAAAFGKRLGLKEEPAAWIDAALGKAKDLDEQLAIARDLCTLAQEPERGQKVFDKAFGEAKGDQQKARVRWMQALVTRDREDVDEEAYPQALAEAQKAYPDTYYGSIARDSLRARTLKPGNDPNPLVGTDTDGKPIALAEYKDRVLIVDFWASWAPPCATVHDTLRSLLKTHGDKGLAVLGVSLDPDLASMQKARSEQGLAWRQVCDGKGREAELGLRWNVGQVPCLFVIGKDGKLLAQHLAPLDKEAVAELEKLVQNALK